MISYAKIHAKEVQNYEFLVKLSKDSTDEFLETEKINPDNPDLVSLKARIETINEILKYVSR